MEQNEIKARTRRDLTIVPFNDCDCMVIACDSCGGVGEKDGDMLKTPTRTVSKFTLRVALTEVLCSGAKPVAVVNGVSCEMSPTGRETILGIEDELKNAGIEDITLTGSTEENFASTMTALTITVVGTAKTGLLRFERAAGGDKLVLLGTPKVGPEVDTHGKGHYEELRRLLNLPQVKEIVPCGSKGIAYEANTLAALGGASVKLYETGIDYHKSAGPATCFLVLCGEPGAGAVLESCPASVAIGEIC
jgi:selenophosphate synthetase-related protein